MLTSQFPPNSAGTGNYVHNISRKLVQKGHHVTVITRGSFKNIERQIVHGINVFRVPFIPIYPFHVSIHGLFVNELVKKLEPQLNIVHSHIPFPPPVKTSLPSVTTVHTPMRTHARHYEETDLSAIAEKLQSTFCYRMEREIINRSDLITTVSHTVPFELSEYGVNPDDVVVIGNGVNEETFKPGEGNRNNSQYRYVLYSGRLGFGKGLFDLIKCAEKLCAAQPDLKFILAGDGPLRARLEEDASALGLQKNIIFLGRVDEDRLVPLYQNATVFVLPSHYEGLPTVLLEAMACGVPPVATAISGNSEVISSRVNGILVPTKDPDMLAAGISDLLSDENLREEMGDAARRTIEESYTLERVCQNLLSCYNQVLQHSS